MDGVQGEAESKKKYITFLSEAKKGKIYLATTGLTIIFTIEFAKIDSSITYGSIEEATVETTSPNATTGPPSISNDISIGNTSTTAQSREAQQTADANCNQILKQ